MLQLPKNQPIQQETMQEGQAKKRQRGTGFTGLQKVLSANVGAGQKMGQAIGGQLGQQAEQVRKGIEQGQSQFQAGLQKEQQKGQEAVSAATGALSSIISGKNAPGNYEQIGENLRNLQYAGPKSIENIEQQQQQASNLAALGRLSGLAGGQQQLLRTQVAGKGRYGLGQSSLDALLLGKEGQRQLQSARTQTAATETQAQQAEKMAQMQAQALENATEASKFGATQKIQKQYEDIQNVASEQAEKFSSDVNKLKGFLDGSVQVGDKEGQISKEEALGLVERAEKGEFGGMEETLFTGDDAQLNATLSAMGRQLLKSLPTGGRRYLDRQKNQAADLATLLSGSKAGRDITNQQYNELLYNPTDVEKSGILGAQEAARQSAMAAARSQDLNPAVEIRKSLNTDRPYYEMMDYLRPGIRAQLDKWIDDNSGFFGYNGKANPTEVFAALGDELARRRELDVADTNYERDERITGKQKPLFNLLREKLGLPKKVQKDMGAPSKREMKQVKQSRIWDPISFKEMDDRAWNRLVTGRYV